MKSDLKAVTKKAVSLLEEILAIKSPTGACENAIDFLAREAKKVGASTQVLAGGALVITVEGKKKSPKRGISAHVDTIGLCVKSIKANGRLTLSPIGGVIPFTVEGEYCSVETLSGKEFRGTILPNKSSIHVHRDLNSFKHSMENLELRLDRNVSSKEDVEKLGIDAGDLVHLDTRTEVTEEGYVKSRHLDDKAGVAILFGVLNLLKRKKRILPRSTEMVIAVSEETGSGAATGFSRDVEELVVVDMGAVGPGQHSDEHSLSICMKDGAGPYNLPLTREFVEICQSKNIPYQRDVYPYYGSDRQSFLSSGGNARVALIGPGVDSSHAYERTHRDALAASIEALSLYLMRP